MAEGLPCEASFPSLEEEDLRKFFPERSGHLPPPTNVEPAGHGSLHTLASLIGMRPRKKKLEGSDSMRSRRSSMLDSRSTHSMSSSGEVAYSTGSQVVVAVVDATKKLSFEAVDWGLLQILQPGDTLVMLGVITKIKSPLGVDILPDVHGFRGVNQVVLDNEISSRLNEYQKRMQARRLYCEKKGFNLDVRITAGHPLRKVVVREAMLLQATWIILDWQLGGHKRYLMDELECSLVLMEKRSENGNFLRISTLSHSTRAVEDGPSLTHEAKLEVQDSFGHVSTRSPTNSLQHLSGDCSDTSCNSFCSFTDEELHTC